MQKIDLVWWGFCVLGGVGYPTGLDFSCANMTGIFAYWKLCLLQIVFESGSELRNLDHVIELRKMVSLRIVFGLNLMAQSHGYTIH